VTYIQTGLWPTYCNINLVRQDAGVKLQWTRIIFENLAVFNGWYYWEVPTSARNTWCWQLSVTVYIVLVPMSRHSVVTRVLLSSDIHHCSDIHVTAVISISLQWHGCHYTVARVSRRLEVTLPWVPDPGCRISINLFPVYLCCTFNF